MCTLTLFYTLLSPHRQHSCVYIQLYVRTSAVLQAHMHIHTHVDTHSSHTHTHFPAASIKIAPCSSLCAITFSMHSPKTAFCSQDQPCLLAFSLHPKGLSVSPFDSIPFLPLSGLRKRHHQKLSLLFPDSFHTPRGALYRECW